MTLAALALAAALAQDPPDAPPVDPRVVPGAGLATEGGPATLWVNPANLAYDPDAGGAAFVRYGPDDLQPWSGAIVGRVGGLSAGFRWFDRPDRNADFTIDLGAGLLLPKRVAVGAAAHWHLVSGTPRNFLAFDLSASWRPLAWLGVTVVTRNIGDPGTRQLAIPQTGAGLAFRPFGRTVILGADYVHTFFPDSVDPTTDLPIDGDTTPGSDVFSFTARIRPTRGLFLRAALDTRLAFGAGLEFYFGGRGVGAWVGTSDARGLPDMVGWVGTDERDEHFAPPRNRVGDLDLRHEPIYLPSKRLLSPSDLSWWEALDQFARAKESAGVRGILLTLGDANLSWARWQELRSAIVRLRASGKDVVVQLEGTVSSGAVFTASAATEVLVHPAATIDLTGVATSSVYYGGLLDAVGVDVEVVRRSDYKSAAESYTERGPSDAEREQQAALLDDLYDELVHGLAEGRARTQDDVRAWVDGGPYTAEEAVRLGIADARAYPDQAARRLDERYGVAVRLLDLSRFPRGRTGWEAPAQIAVVYVDGPIVDGASRTGRVLPFPAAGSDTIIAQLERAARDPETRAVVLRVDSPGGSSFASDAIWRAVERVKSAGKPVVVSMGGVAASGGYYISAGADAIWAEPTTVTGSIGVLAMKPNVAGLLDRFGVTTWQDTRGRNAGMASPLQPWDPVQRARMEALVDSDYQQFKERVAVGRGMTLEAVEEVARGRVWSGRDAAQLGLVDELGGLTEAVLDAKARAGIPERRPIEVVGLRERRSVSDVLLPDLSLLPARMAMARMERAMAAVSTDGLAATALPVEPLLRLLWMSSQRDLLWRIDPNLLDGAPR